MYKDLRAFLGRHARSALERPFGRFLYSTQAYSQEGEDLVLRRLLENRASGIYVDIGAHHPYRFSNTALLYRRGWRGINVDARPGSMAAFTRERPRDVNLELGVGERLGSMTYFMFKEAALNTFDIAVARAREKDGWPRAGQCEVECRPLSKVIDQSLPKLAADTVDLLSIDVEGLDLEVLRSNDWSRHAPSVVVVEIPDCSLEDCLRSEVAGYLASVGYAATAKLCQSVIFQRVHESVPGGAGRQATKGAPT